MIRWVRHRDVVWMTTRVLFRGLLVIRTYPLHTRTHSETEHRPVRQRWYLHSLPGLRAAPGFPAVPPRIVRLSVT